MKQTKEYKVSRLLINDELQGYLDALARTGWEISEAVFRQADGFWMVIMEREFYDRTR